MQCIASKTLLCRKCIQIINVVEEDTLFIRQLRHQQRFNVLTGILGGYLHGTVFLEKRLSHQS